MIYQHYTVTVYRCDPATLEGAELEQAALPDWTDLSIESDDAYAVLTDTLRNALEELDAEDGYKAGDTLHAVVWDENGECVAAGGDEILPEHL